MNKKYSVAELRELFLSFFESKEHLRLNSFSLIPKNDDSLLLINSGMAPLKPYFTGQETPPRKRVTTCQKCIRTGDIDNIGKTARHGTFFEMLGNFSFGDYFKKEAITWSWEFLTETIGLDKDRLYPSVYIDDQEAYDLWIDYIGIPEDRIFKFGKEDNFWEHGSGPCGPCSEIYYDRGEKYGCGKADCKVGCDCDRYMEVWNNVFTQFNNDGKNNYTELKQKNIDTGMGLERLAVVVQDVESIFEVDTNKDLMETISLISRHIYKENPVDDISLRIIADHIKSCTFMIGDGILPSNEGRGYVLRRLIRRAVRHGKKLGIKELFMSELAIKVIELNGTFYKELSDRKDMIIKILTAEEEKFNQTIDQGLNIFNDICSKIASSNNKTFSGDDAFKLYDTFGFPIDLTKELLEEKNIKLDEDRFKELMQKQKDTARTARKVSNYMGADETAFNSLSKDMVSEFIGYDSLENKGKILSLAIITDDGYKIVDEIDEGDVAVIITDKTPFYPMMGGQVGDKGIIETETGRFVVEDTIKILNTKIGHVGRVDNGQFSVNEIVNLLVDKNDRHLTAINHTSTHLLHAALREVLGKHVAQAGSYVGSDRLRFDFTHFSAMTNEEKDKVENIVNSVIDESVVVVKKVMPIDEAKKEGAIALFGEKYGAEVRTVKVSDFSFELCGGTHIDNTNEIKYFKIISEESVASGVRRIEAITNKAVIDFYKDKFNTLKSIETVLKTTENGLLDRLNQIVVETKELKQENEKLKKEISKNEITDISANNCNGINVIVNKINDKDMNSLKEYVDTLKDKFADFAIVVVSSKDNNPYIVASMSDAAIKKGLHAGNIIKEIAPIIGGNGGGKDKFAQAGGKDSSKLSDVVEKTKDLIVKKLEG